jgi:hypothetical protein
MKQPKVVEFKAGAEVKADENAATKLIALAQAEPDLFHDVTGDAYATVLIDGHHETLSIRSGAFKRFLTWKFHANEGKSRPAPGSQRSHPHH